MRAFVFRHGETEHNRSRVTLGREDIPLNELGRRQALAIAEGYGGHAFEAVYASPLSRAVTTAEPLAQGVGLEVLLEPGFIEMDVGELGSLTGEELRERHAEFLVEWGGPGVGDLRLPGGETLREVQERAWAALEALSGRHQGDVAVFTHNFVSLVLLCHALGVALADFRRVRQDLGAVSVIRLVEGKAFVERMNDGCHLAGVGSDIELR